MAGNILSLVEFFLWYVNKFPYLGLLTSVCGTRFTSHITGGCKEVLSAFCAIRNSSRLPFMKAPCLFARKVAPVVA